MKTHIAVDTELLTQALIATGLSDKNEVVAKGLKLLIQRENQQAIRKLRGKLKWQGDLDEMRVGRLM